MLKNGHLCKGTRQKSELRPHLSPQSRTSALLHSSWVTKLGYALVEAGLVRVRMSIFEMKVYDNENPVTDLPVGRMTNIDVMSPHGFFRHKG